MITQQDRLLEFISPLGQDALVLTHCKGGETLSSGCGLELDLKLFGGRQTLFHGFKFELALFSEKTDINSADILGKAVSVKIKDTEETPRFFNGIVKTFKSSTIDHNNHRQYQIELVPWFDALKLTSDCKVFQNQTVPQIFTSVCKQVGFSDFDISKLSKTCTLKDYCVQYNETMYDFLNRILEEEGIFYYYQHTEQSHILTLADSSASLPKTANPVVCTNSNRGAQHLSHWTHDAAFSSSAVTMAGFNFEAPSAPIVGTATSKTTPPTVGTQSAFERYQYNCAIQQGPVASQLATQKLGVLTWLANLIHADGNYTQMTPGNQFSLTDHDDTNETGDYVVVAVEHDAEDTTQRHGKESSHSYKNKVTCISSDIPFVPVIRTAKPVLTGLQSAVVVGATGQEIYTDEYARVKVQFHWDRYGKLDENSSCWLRVGQLWSGDQWGSQFIPRVGDEVVVGFLGGDIDQPIIVGSVYNASNREPYELPANANMSGIKTRIKDSLTGHEFSFDDTSGAQKISLHSEGDLVSDIKNDSTRIVAGNEQMNVVGDTLIQVLDGNTTIKAKEIQLIAGGNKVVINDSGILISQ